MAYRLIWRRAHPVRLPSRNTAVHDELRAAYLSDLIRERQEIENAVAAEVERDLQFVGIG